MKANIFVTTGLTLISLTLAFNAEAGCKTQILRETEPSILQATLGRMRVLGVSSINYAGAFGANGRIFFMTGSDVSLGIVSEAGAPKEIRLVLTSANEHELNSQMSLAAFHAARISGEKEDGIRLALLDKARHMATGQQTFDLFGRSGVSLTHPDVSTFVVVLGEMACG
jgi:hypothetical protein